VAAHDRRCTGRLWVDAVVDATLVTGSMAELLAELLPPELVDRPTLSADRLISPGPGEYLRIDVCQGITVRSPVAGVRSRRWVHVAAAGLRQGGEAAVRRALTAESFALLETELVLDVVSCPHCGEMVKRRGLSAHQATNMACRWRQAVGEVRERWANGSRDPWSVPGAPLEWGALKAKATWARRLEVVAFPRWAAVLLAPAPSTSGSQAGEAISGARTAPTPGPRG